MPRFRYLHQSRSRNAQRRITLNNAMSITPSTLAEKARGGFKTWVSSQRKFHPSPGHFSVEINSYLHQSRKMPLTLLVTNIRLWLSFQIDAVVATVTGKGNEKCRP